MSHQILSRSGKLCGLVLCGALLFNCLFPTTVPAKVPVKLTAQTPALVITHVTVIDMVRPRPRADMTVIVRGNRISSITKSGRVRIPKNAQVIDGRGKFLIPGLWDMHVHALRNERFNFFFPLFIANGITGIRDMGTTAEGFAALPQLRKQIANGERIGPRIFAAGRILDGPRPVVPENSIPFNTPAEARKIVRSLKKGGADFIKVYDGVPRESYFAISDEARRLNLAVVGHVPTAITAFEASDAGQKDFEHLGNILRSCSILTAMELDERTAAQWNISGIPDGPAGIPARISKRTQIELDSYSNQKCLLLFARLKKNGTWQVPTLVTKHAQTFVDSLRQAEDPRRKYIPPAMLESWRPENNFLFKYRTPEFIEIRKRLYEKEVELVRAMHRAGVSFMAGSDIPAPYMYPGFSLHDELGLLVEAGLTPFEALLAATRKPAEFMNLSRDLGTVQTGKLADLILLDANPLEKISNTKQIRAVIFDGRYLSKEMLEKTVTVFE